jgi:DNA-directed RNA polymerase subunit omega
MDKQAVFKESLTNEKIRTKFTSQFELVSYAIKLAENMIKTGRGSRVKTDSQNRALQILAEIASGKDVFDDIPEAALTYPAETYVKEHREPKEREGKESGKAKKPRKILMD